MTKQNVGVIIFTWRVWSVGNHLIGLAVKASASRASGPGSITTFSVGIFWGSSYTSDFNIGTLVATLPGDWYQRVSAGTGWPDVSIL